MPRMIKLQDVRSCLYSQGCEEVKHPHIDTISLHYFDYVD